MNVFPSVTGCCDFDFVAVIGHNMNEINKTNWPKTHFELLLIMMVACFQQQNRNLYFFLKNKIEMSLSF